MPNDSELPSITPARHASTTAKKSASSSREDEAHQHRARRHREGVVERLDGQRRVPVLHRVRDRTPRAAAAPASPTSSSPSSSPSLRVGRKRRNAVRQNAKRAPTISSATSPVPPTCSWSRSSWSVCARIPWRMTRCVSLTSSPSPMTRWPFLTRDDGVLHRVRGLPAPRVRLRDVDGQVGPHHAAWPAAAPPGAARAGASGSRLPGMEAKRSISA